MHSRVQPGVPAGGQFDVKPRTEPDVALNLDSVMEEAREAMVDPDDPYGADLVEDQLAQASSLRTGDRVDLEAAVHEFHPDDLVGDPADPFEMIADADRTGDAVRLRTDRATLVVPDEYVVPRAPEGVEEALRRRGLTDAVGRLRASLAQPPLVPAPPTGGVNTDAMSPEQRQQFDATHRHAYDYASSMLGGADVPDQDAAEAFASWGADQFVSRGFDAEGLSWQTELPPWAEQHRREQAAQQALARFPEDVRLLTELTTEQGRPVSTRTPKAEQAELRDLVERLRADGLEVETHEFAGTKYSRLSGHTTSITENGDR